MHYNKPARTLPDLLTHLAAKGLTIPDPAHALSILTRISYYRLLIYMRPLQDSATKTFHPNVQFDDVVNLYEFDRKLRLLCLDAIERIEVALRAALVNTLALQHSPHCYLDPIHFNTPKDQKFFEGKVQDATKQGNPGFNHYLNTYTQPTLPPLWTVMEGVTFGTLSRLLSNLIPSNQKLVAKEFHYDRAILVSWFRSINGLRNMCAHHNWVWNAIRNSDSPTMQARRLTQQITPPNTNTFCARAVVLGALMQEIDPSSDWRIRMRNLITSHTFIVPGAMGFPAGWDQLAFWNT